MSRRFLQSLLAAGLALFVALPHAAEWTLSKQLYTPNLLVPGRKPVAPVEVDYRNSAMRSVSGFWSIQSPTLRGLVKGIGGTLQNGALFGVSGDGPAIYFDGDTSGPGDYAVVGETTDYQYGTTGSVTIAARVQLAGVQKYDNAGTTLGFVAGKGGLSATNPGFALYLSDEQAALQVRDNSENRAIIIDTVALNDNRPHSLVGVVDRGSDSAKLYVDGRFVGSDSLSAVGSISNSQSVHLGRRYDTDTDTYAWPFWGYISGLIIFDRALSEPEALSITRSFWSGLKPSGLPDHFALKAPAAGPASTIVPAIRNAIGDL